METSSLCKDRSSECIRGVPLAVSQFWLMLLRVPHPRMGELCWFLDKALPFGHLISCSHFQRFSNGLRHIVETISGKKHHLVNYLDDYLYIETSEEKCNKLVRIFLRVCEEIKFLVAMEKTEWAASRVVFLGVLLDGNRHCLVAPEDKRVKTLDMVRIFADRKKGMVKRAAKVSRYTQLFE